MIQDLEISDGNINSIFFYTYVTLFLMFSITILHSAKNGVKISRFLKTLF